jgi:hypothetical protein
VVDPPPDIARRELRVHVREKKPSVIRGLKKFRDTRELHVSSAAGVMLHLG